MSRTFASVLPRQSPSFLILSSMKSEADSAVTGFFMRCSHVCEIRYVKNAAHPLLRISGFLSVSRDPFCSISRGGLYNDDDTSRSCSQPAHGGHGLSDAEKAERAGRPASTPAGCAASGTAAGDGELCTARTRSDRFSDCALS